MAKTPRASEPEADVPVNVNLKNLAALVSQGKAMEDAERAKSGGVQRSYVKIITKPQDPILDEGDKAYIKGAKLMNFVIANRKIVLGPKFTCTVLGLFKIYEETLMKDAGKDDEMPKVLGYWMPEDAEQIEVDGIFDRPFISRDGKPHVLKPVHWAVIRIDKHAELDDTLFAFRSVGNSVFKELEKLLKSNTQIAPQAKIQVTVQKIANKYGASFYPKFELAGMNFALKDNGEPKEVEGGMDKAEIAEVIQRWSGLYEEYASAKMVARKPNVAALIAGPGTAPALPTAGGTGGTGSKRGANAKAVKPAEAEGDDDNDRPNF